jgi:hypothetical protein
VNTIVKSDYAGNMRVREMTHTVGMRLERRNVGDSNVEQGDALPSQVGHHRLYVSVSHVARRPTIKATRCQIHHLHMPGFSASSGNLSTEVILGYGRYRARTTVCIVASSKITFIGMLVMENHLWLWHKEGRCRAMSSEATCIMISTLQLLQSG